MKTVTVDILQQAMTKKGYAFFTNDTKDYNINIIGIRSNDMIPNTFNDKMCVCWKYNGTWNLRQYDCTTDPGLYYLQNPMNSNGTAILVPGQYRGAYCVGLHKGYEALRQQKPMKYWRDVNRDGKFDMTGKIYEEIGYTDIHRANDTKKSLQVDKWSAGCQVIADSKDFNEFMRICNNAKNIYGNSFTYTLLTENNL